MTTPVHFGDSRERTVIAWGRTSLTSAGLGVLLLRLGIDRAAPVEIAAAIAAFVLSASLALHGRRSSVASPIVPAVRALRWVTAVVVIVGVLAVIGALG